ncbi:MAG: hypothetical protein IPK03_13340 [Bacteroidetes bacterium]|nr:hypothetical protein [Bacteroidota bacterium]
MKQKIKLITALLFLNSFIIHAQPKTWQWINDVNKMTTYSFDGRLDQGNTESMQIDDSGNVYVHCIPSNAGSSLVKNGNSGSTITLPGVLSSTSGGFSMLAKFNCKGDMLWYKRSSSVFSGMVIDKNANIFIVRANDTPSVSISVFDKDTLRRTPSNTPRRGNGWFLVKYDRNGNLMFRTKFEMEYQKDPINKNFVNFNKAIDHCIDYKGNLIVLFVKDTGNIIGQNNTFDRGFYLIKADGNTGNITLVKKIANISDRGDLNIYKDTLTFNNGGTFRKLSAIGDRIWVRVRAESDYFKFESNFGVGLKYGKLIIDGSIVDSVRHWEQFQVIMDENFNYVGKFKPLTVGQKNHLKEGIFYTTDPQPYGNSALVIYDAGADSTKYNGQFLKDLVKPKYYGGLNIFKVTKDGIVQKASFSNFASITTFDYNNMFNQCGIDPLTKNISIPINNINRGDGSNIFIDSFYFNQTPVSSIHAGTGKTKFMEIDSNLNYVGFWKDSIAGFDNAIINFQSDSRGNYSIFGAKANGSLVGLNGVNYPATNTCNQGQYSDYFILKYGDTVCTFCNKPTGSFSLSAVNRNLTVTDNSTNGTNYVWKWGDNTANGTGKNPGTHTYAANGTYTVCRIMSNACGSDSSCQQITITCTKPSGGYKTTINKRVLSINDSSVNATSITWIWGDGTSNGSGATPSHTYGKDSSFKLCRIATNVCGADTNCKTILIKTT